MILSLPEIFVLCWHIMKFGIYMWTGRACVKFFFEIQNLVSQVPCVSFGLLLWTMCISVFFYCGGCGGRGCGGGCGVSAQVCVRACVCGGGDGC